MARHSIATIKRAARKAQGSGITEREEPGETEDRAESAQYEAGEEGSEPMPGAKIGREDIAPMSPRRPRRPF